MASPDNNQFGNATVQALLYGAQNMPIPSPSTQPLHIGQPNSAGERLFDISYCFICFYISSVRLRFDLRHFASDVYLDAGAVWHA